MATKDNYEDVVNLVKKERGMTIARNQKLVRGADLQRRMAVGAYFTQNVVE